jgi:hypothetical protein
METTTATQTGEWPVFSEGWDDGEQTSIEAPQSMDELVNGGQ